MSDEHRRPSSARGDSDGLPVRVGLVAFLAIAGFYLWAEHKAHLIGALPYLPYLVFLACPVIHIFMHRGHGGHGGNNHQDAGEGGS